VTGPNPVRKCLSLRPGLFGPVFGLVTRFRPHTAPTRLRKGLPEDRKQCYYRALSTGRPVVGQIPQNRLNYKELGRFARRYVCPSIGRHNDCHPHVCRSTLSILRLPAGSNICSWLVSRVVRWGCRPHRTHRNRQHGRFPTWTGTPTSENWSRENRMGFPSEFNNLECVVWMLRGRSIAIVGHGAFAVENVRTCRGLSF
jgi:hypothetical protein